MVSITSLPLMYYVFIFAGLFAFFIVIALLTVFRTKIWNMRGIPYFSISIVDDSNRVVYQRTFKDTGQKWMFQKKEKRAYLIPKGISLIQNGMRKQIIWNVNNSMPLLSAGLNENEIKEITELKKQYKSIIERFRSSDENIEDYEVNKKAGYYRKDVDPVWLFESLTSKACSDIMETPKDKWEALMPFVVIIVIIISAVAILYIVKQPDTVVINTVATGTGVVR